MQLAACIAVGLTIIVTATWTVRTLMAADPSHLGFPEELEAEFKNPQYLYTGGFGKVWLATQNGKPVAVKLLHYNYTQFLTWQLASQKGFEEQYEDLLEAAGECDAARSMRHGGKESDKGSKYIMDCYRHNIKEPPPGLPRDSPSMKEPLYLVMEFCGHHNLADFALLRAQEHKWTPELAMEIYVQLLEALAYLGRHPTKWVHHDLKPLNIVVHTTPEKTLEIRLVDFGAAAVGTPENQYEITASTPHFYPLEYGQIVEHQGRKTMINFKVCTNDPKCLQKFDMFSATAIFGELIFGHSPLGFLSGEDVDEPSHAQDAGTHTTAIQAAELALFQTLQETISDPAWFVKIWGVAHGYEVTSAAFKKQGSTFNRVLVKALKCLDENPALRPTAAEMLDFIKTEGFRL